MDAKHNALHQSDGQSAGASRWSQRSRRTYHHDRQWQREEANSPMQRRIVTTSVSPNRGASASAAIHHSTANLNVGSQQFSGIRRPYADSTAGTAFDSDVVSFNKRTQWHLSDI